MQLTTQQKATFLAWLNANASALSDDAAAALANTVVAPSYFVWLSAASKATVDAQIVKADYTPSDAPPASPSTDMTYQNRALVCQLKQTNAQWLTSGPASVSTIDARPASVRQNFKDCLTAIPSGAAGANTDAGWGGTASPAAVRQALMRTVTNFEKLFVLVAAAGPGNVGTDPRGNNTNPDILGIGADGQEIASPVTGQNVSDVRNGL